VVLATREDTDAWRGKNFKQSQRQPNQLRVWWMKDKTYLLTLRTGQGDAGDFTAHGSKDSEKGFTTTTPS